MISGRKKKGFTITELVIVMTLTVVVLGIVWSMFSISNKIISDVTIKSDLQREGQAIQEKLSNVGMQAIKIDKITLIDKTTFIESEFTDFNTDDEKNYEDLTDLFTDVSGNKPTETLSDNEKYLNVNEIIIITKEEVQGADPTAPKTIEEVSYTIKYTPTPNSEINTKKSRGKLTIKKQGGAEKVIGEDVESITIKPGNPSVKLSQTNAIQFSINLLKKIGAGDIKYSIPVNVSFRNKIIS